MRPGDLIPDDVPLAQKPFIAVGQEVFFVRIVIPRLERFLATLTPAERESFLAQFFAEMHDANRYFVSRTLPENTRDAALAAQALHFVETHTRR